MAKRKTIKKATNKKAAVKKKQAKKPAKKKTKDAMLEFVNDKATYDFHKRYVINWLQTKIEYMEKKTDAAEIEAELTYLAGRINDVRELLAGAVHSYTLN